MSNIEEAVQKIAKQVCDLEKVVSNNDIFYFKLVLFSNIVTMIVSFASGYFFGYIFGRGSQERLIEEVLKNLNKK